ncbi:hypothetical protein GpartN1_g5524.t1 [Galdieria partita]|uniref:Uncharacterized protein n=1 Tax=Galdieria partita TaxID=83374 RepID=A0A9C7UQU1_9RHOD|nr:hypothetical protein GpartN1_g3847.t1 [Galdieria partita]GJQ13733.1 hypothetical protein GpartN1_g5524.t1 [Galdieria partita]
MIHDSDASTLAPDSPLNTYKPNATNSPENIKARLRFAQNDKTNFEHNYASKKTKTLAKSKTKKEAQSNQTKCKKTNKSTTSNYGRRVSKSFISSNGQVKQSNSSEDSCRNKPSCDNQFQSEEIDNQENESFQQVSEKFKILQENWSLRWEILYMKWQRLQSTLDIHQPEPTDKIVYSQDAPIVEISNMWKMFMDNMALVKLHDNQDGSIVTYSLDSTSEFCIAQEHCVSTNQRISFLLHLLHEVIALYKRPEANLESNCFEQKLELFYQVWNSLTEMLCDITHTQSQFASIWQNLQQFLIGLFSDIVYGNIQVAASEKILQVFFHTNMTQITENLGRQLKTAIVEVIDRYKTALLEQQSHHLLLTRYTDLALLLERLPCCVWDQQNETALEQIATTLTFRFPFIATLLFAVSLHHKYKSAASAAPLSSQSQTS